jgi:quinol monooxygenase YgiN
MITMAFVCSATWIARPGQEDTVRSALAELSPASRREPGNLYYQAHQNPEEPRIFRIFEVYVDEDAFKAHGASAHFEKWALGQAIPALETRQRDFSETLDF